MNRVFGTSNQEESMNFPIWIIVGFQQRYMHDSQNLNNDTFSELSVTSAPCIIATDKYPNSSIFLNDDDDDLS